MLLTRRPRRDERRSRGQSLVEFALVVPVLLLILLLAIDFGRAFYSWVIVQNASRIGANFAGLNAQAWEANPDTASVVAEYRALIDDDLDNAACDRPALGAIPDPVFSDSAADTSSGDQTPDTSYDVGDSVSVTLSCTFHPFTPIVSAVVGNNVQLRAATEFRIRSGDIAGLANAAPIPQPSIPTPTPVPTPTPTSTPTGTAGPGCTVNASFSRNPSGGSVANGTDMIFTNGSSASNCSIVSYAWDFPTGSPASATGAGPHTVDFSVQGTVTVTLTVTTDTGATDSATDSFQVRR